MPKQGHLPHRASVSGCGILSHRYPCRRFGILLKWKIELTKICLKFLPILSSTNIGKRLEIRAFHHEFPPKTALRCKNPEGKLANRDLKCQRAASGSMAWCGIRPSPSAPPSKGSTSHTPACPTLGLEPPIHPQHGCIRYPFAKMDLEAKFSTFGGSTYLPSNKGESSPVKAWNASERPYHDYTLYNTPPTDPLYPVDLRIDRHCFFRKWRLA